METRGNMKDMTRSCSRRRMDGEILQRIYMPTVSETIYHQIGLLSQNVVYIWMSGVYYLIIL